MTTKNSPPPVSASAPSPVPTVEGGHNLPERSVSELSADLKRTVEESFGRVRVRGEISQPKVAGSGHCYLRLKDEGAVLDAVIWRGAMQKLGIRPEEGVEVVATGRLTTYPGKSSYQLVIEAMDLAGEGALLKLLEDRKRRLAAEGLFDPARKKRLPFLPRVIGVVTSPTGAVIRDILHRLADRFPMHVLLWPVLVQGEGAAEQVAAAIAGFNRLSGENTPRPDLLIIARGGGSLEDLMAFNEEAVVRAVAASEIPVISAVGHETDTTLCDFAADLRAPTPTGAAEMAVPVRLDLLAQVAEDQRRLLSGMRRRLEEGAVRLQGLARGLPPLDRWVEEREQRLDDRWDRTTQAMRTVLERKKSDVATLGGRLRRPSDLVIQREAEVVRAVQNLRRSAEVYLNEYGQRLRYLSVGLRPDSLRREVERGVASVMELRRRLEEAKSRIFVYQEKNIFSLSERLEASSHKSVLKRGYALVRDAQGTVIDRREMAKPGSFLVLELQDGDVTAKVVGGKFPASSDKPKESETANRQPRLL